MKKFAFVNDAAEREYKELPEKVQDEFGKDLRRVQYESDPILPINHLTNIGSGVIELKLNGSPAYRCLYITKFLETVIVLYSFTKTTNGVDRKAMAVAQTRFKELKRVINDIEC